MFHIGSFDTMWIVEYLRARSERGLGLQSLGPNEARVLYDAVVDVLGLVACVGFCRLFQPAMWHASGRDTFVLLLPAAALLFNSVLGIYSRFKTASGRKKSAMLLVATLCTGAVIAALSGNQAVVAMWMLVVYGPLALARLLLNLPYGKHHQLSAIAVNRRGPVVVLGGAGYIGSHLVEQLLSDGFRVRVLDRFMYGRDSLGDFREHPNLDIVEGDATDIAKLTLVMKQASAVVHLAGLVGDPACAVDDQFTRHTNIVATRMAKEVAQALGVHRFVFASSCSVYGVSDKEVNETGALNPVSLYARTKIDSERELLSATRDGFFVTVLRFATVFGHSKRPRFDLVANLFTAQAMIDGLITVIGPHQWRPFVHVSDLARAIVMTLKANPMTVQNQIFNVGDKTLNMTILQLAELVHKTASAYRPVSISVTENPEDRRNYAVSFEKIRSLLKFQAATSMEAGVAEMAEKLALGNYEHYREDIYSNVKMTARALSRFQDPVEAAHLYGPLQVYASKHA
jgi:nucleoside-diphosphate-sugar epimerase